MNYSFTYTIVTYSKTEIFTFAALGNVSRSYEHIYDIVCPVCGLTAVVTPVAVLSNEHRIAFKNNPPFQSKEKSFHPDSLTLGAIVLLRCLRPVTL